MQSPLQNRRNRLLGSESTHVREAPLRPLLRESILQEARDKQVAILKEAANTREAIVEDARVKAREESARIISDAKAEIESQKQAAITAIRQQVALLSVEVSEKVLRKKLDTDQAQMDYINLMLDEVTANDK